MSVFKEYSYITKVLNCILCLISLISTSVSCATSAVCGSTGSVAKQDGIVDIKKKMKENEFLLNIDNKEILIEILNHSIDFLIGNQDEQQTMRIAHKYGFHNPDDFLLTTRTIAKIYRTICTNDNYSSRTLDSDLVKSELVNLSPEFQKIVISALHSRRREVLNSLIREQNSGECQLVESFDWDTRLVLGDSSYAGNLELLTTVTLNLRQSRSKTHELHIQMDYEKLNEFIKQIGEALQQSK